MNRALLTLAVLLISLTSGRTHATSAAGAKKAMNLSTYQSWGYTVDSSPQGQRVRHLLLRLRELGFNHLTFNIRAHMVTGRSHEIRSAIPLAEQATEERLLADTIAHAHRLGFTTGLRPILLVVGPRGEFPYTADAETWWHGIIEPREPAKWFEAWGAFHERYLALARRTGMRSYTIGAELHSMTTGLGERRRKRPRGYPALWSRFASMARERLGPGVEIIYDWNYTDQYVLADGLKRWGGELEQLRWELTRKAKSDDDRRFQQDLGEFVRGLDVIGVDMYRALASRSMTPPKDHGKLVALLKDRADAHATQLDTLLLDLEIATGFAKPLELKELGYRSVEKSFLDPSAYESEGGKLSVAHQAAAWEAIFLSFWTPGWPWFGGLHVWETNVDREHDSARDRGFSPLGKPESEAVFKRFFSL